VRQPHHRQRTGDGTPFGSFLETLAQGAAALGRAPRARFRRALPPDKPVPGTYAHLEESMRWARELPVRDFRSNDRQAIDRAWAGALDECRRRFGIAPGVELADQRDPGAEAALRRAREAEAAFLALSRAPHARPDTVEAAFQTFASQVASWLNVATAGWATARERASQAHREGRMR
jgi:hypothetical protein